MATTTFGRRFMATIKYNDWTHLSKTPNRDFSEMVRLMSAAVGLGVGLPVAVGLSYHLSDEKIVKSLTPVPFYFKWPFSSMSGFLSGYLTYKVVSSPAVVALLVATVTPALLGEKLKEMEGKN